MDIAVSYRKLTKMGRETQSNELPQHTGDLVARHLFWKDIKIR